MAGGGGTDKFAQYKVELLKNLLPSKPSRILDFGCGVGRSIGHLKNYFPGAKIYGCDVSEESLELAEKYTTKEFLFLNKDVETVFERGPFDLITLACVLHHIQPEARKYWIDGLKTAMSENGYLAVFEHNTLNPVTKSIILDKNNIADDITWMLRHKELKELLGGHKYWSGYTFFSPVRFPGVLTVERLLKWLPLGAQQCVIIRK